MKAFDLVIHPALFYKMHKIGIGGNFMKIIQSMYDSNMLCVKISSDK